MWPTQSPHLCSVTWVISSKTGSHNLKRFRKRTDHKKKSSNDAITLSGYHCYYVICTLKLIECDVLKPFIQHVRCLKHSTATRGCAVSDLGFIQTFTHTTRTTPIKHLKWLQMRTCSRFLNVFLTEDTLALFMFSCTDQMNSADLCAALGL